jgi:PAS domain S-box-containing protein
MLTLFAQRLRAQTLMSVALQFPAFPIVMETYRACLQDTFDMPALREVLRAAVSGEVRIHEVETATASPFARSLVFAYVAAYLYEGDSPAAERRAQALSLDLSLLRELLGEADLREFLDARLVDEVEDQLQRRTPLRRARNADELHDLLRQVGDLSLDELRERSDELNRVNAFLESVLAGMQGGVIVIDRGLQVVAWNHRSEDLWGARIDEVKGENLMTLDIGLPVELLRQAIRVCLSGEQELVEQTVAATNRRGLAVQCRVTCTPLKGSGGESRGVILLVDEIAGQPESEVKTVMH